jgi:hypothetical protein
LRETFLRAFLTLDDAFLSERFEIFLTVFVTAFLSDFFIFLAARETERFLRLGAERFLEDFLRLGAERFLEDFLRLGAERFLEEAFLRLGLPPVWMLSRSAMCELTIVFIVL